MSRLSVQPLAKGNFEIIFFPPPINFRMRTPTPVAILYSAGRLARKPQTAYPKYSIPGRIPPSYCLAHNLRSKSGSGIFTGHTTWHSPRGGGAGGGAGAGAGPAGGGGGARPAGPG